MATTRMPRIPMPRIGIAQDRRRQEPQAESARTAARRREGGGWDSNLNSGRKGGAKLTAGISHPVIPAPEQGAEAKLGTEDPGPGNAGKQL